MLGVEDYGSGSEDDSNNEPTLQPASSSATHPSKRHTHISSTTTAKSKRPPKKIAIGLPTLRATENDDEDDLKEDRPAAKRARLQSGAGASSLLSMLPAPKQKNPTLPSAARVLGGGKGPGLVFGTSEGATNAMEDPGVEEGPTDQTSPAFSFLPSSLAKGKSNISVEEEAKRTAPRVLSAAAPSVDFFSLGSATSSKVGLPTSTTTSSLPLMSSAPVVSNFSPPEPTPTDEYPGYYQLPSGAWAAHDPIYYAAFAKKWESEYNAHVRALEKGMVKGFEGLESAAVEEVDAMKEMEKAKLELRDREERKAVTHGADGGPVAPKMNINASKLSGRARSRHQLATLLNEAYENREALEERIAEGRRNRKEAGNKYGF